MRSRSRTSDEITRSRLTPEIRTYLEADSTLRDWGVETVLIGSYARHTAIWPGKDVDVFTKLTRLSVGATNPRTIFEHARDILVEA
jgi:tRNA nucleotidyltransferase (CCA-adding enzyme)